MPSRDLTFVDCNAGYGPKPLKHAEERWTLDHLLEDLDLARIAGALVHNRLARHYDPMLANLQLVRDLEPHRERLFPCWMALPPVSGDFPDAAEFVKLLRAHNVRAVRIEPDTFRLPLDESLWRDLRDALRQEEVLVVLPQGGFTIDPCRIDRLLDLFSDCPTLIIDQRWTHWRLIVHLMRKYPRLHMEFSAFQANRGIEYFVGEFGAERCLFGTGLPEMAAGAAKGFLDWTLLDDEPAGLVAGGNLRRLLGGRGPTCEPGSTPWSDALTSAAGQGQPLPCPVLDDHCHILHDGGVSAGGPLVFVRGDADGMIELTRKMGIDKTAIMSWVGPLSMDADLGNEIVAAAVRRYPNEFIGLATINPEHQSEAEIEAVIQHYHLELGFPGLKTLCGGQNINYDDPAFARWYSFGNDHRLYAVVDPCGAMEDEPMANLARRYPQLGIHLDHCGQSWAYAKWAVSLMRQHPNIWAQMNYTAVRNGTIEYIADKVGADRVLFGTDAPMRDPRPQLGWAVYTRLDQADKRRILGGNFADILRQTQLPNFNLGM